ncbi:MAG: trehalose-phosphatase [Gemmatimonadota bacterium]
MSDGGETDSLPHARDRVEDWTQAWREHGGIVVLLDFDGTLAPIVERPNGAAMPESTRESVQRLIEQPGAYVAIVSGRGLADARERAGLPGIAYAGNHGMEIHGAGLDRIHPDAVAARPRLERVITELSDSLSSVPGAIVEDKGLTLSVHYRLVVRALVDRVRKQVTEAVAGEDGLRVTEGKEVLEIRPDVDWHKGRAVDFLLESLRPKPGTPILYIGDDRTDEDAFEALREWGGEGVIVAERLPARTAARAFVETTEEVAQLIDLLVTRAPR